MIPQLDLEVIAMAKAIALEDGGDMNGSPDRTGYYIRLARAAKKGREKSFKNIFSGDQRVHALKCWPVYFEAVRSGLKRFEIRVNDRGFQAGDILTLREWNPTFQEYTGNSLQYRVGYILSLREYGDVKGWWWPIVRRAIPNLAIISLVPVD
jgi:hypothetical protein